MSDEGIVVPGGGLGLPGGWRGFERTLETLIAIARREGRPFLVYLLSMALVHVRDEDGEDEGRASLGH
jgi:hypothetical protein